MLAKAKLNIISSHVSTALLDDKISDEKFRLIVDEIEKYNPMKETRDIQGAVRINETKRTPSARPKRVKLAPTVVGSDACVCRIFQCTSVHVYIELHHSAINKSDKPAHCSEAGVDHWPAFHCTAETVASTA